MTAEEGKAEEFELWVSYPGHRAYISVADHFQYASRPGWWALPWRGDAEAVRARRGVPITLENRKK